MEITSNFKMIFITVVFITIGSIIGIGLLAILGNEAADLGKIPIMQQNFYAACSFGWQSGIGAIFGLLGGKATATEES